MFGHTSYKNREGLKGGNIAKGTGMSKGPTWQWNMESLFRGLGISHEDYIDKFKDKDLKDPNAFAEAIDKYTGWVLKPNDGTGDPIKGKIPLTFGDRTYQVDDKGIKIVNEKFLEEIVTESLQREDHVNDVTDLLLYVGDMGVAAISKALYDDLEGYRPSEVRNTVTSEELGKKLLNMKRVVNKHIDNIVIPEATLEKIRQHRRKHHKDSLDAKLMKTPDEAPPL